MKLTISNFIWVKTLRVVCIIAMIVYTLEPQVALSFATMSTSQNSTIPEGNQVSGESAVSNQQALMDNSFSTEVVLTTGSFGSHSISVVEDAGSHSIKVINGDTGSPITSISIASDGIDGNPYSITTESNDDGSTSTIINAKSEDGKTLKFIHYSADSNGNTKEPICIKEETITSDFFNTDVLKESIAKVVGRGSRKKWREKQVNFIDPSTGNIVQSNFYTDGNQPLRTVLYATDSNGDMFERVVIEHSGGDHSLLKIYDANNPGTEVSMAQVYDPQYIYDNTGLITSIDADTTSRAYEHIDFHFDIDLQAPTGNGGIGISNLGRGIVTNVDPNTVGVFQIGGITSAASQAEISTYISDLTAHLSADPSLVAQYSNPIISSSSIANGRGKPNALDLSMNSSYLNQIPSFIRDQIQIDMEIWDDQSNLIADFPDVTYDMSENFYWPPDAHWGANNSGKIDFVRVRFTINGVLSIDQTVDLPDWEITTIDQVVNARGQIETTEKTIDLLEYDTYDPSVVRSSTMWMNHDTGEYRYVSTEPGSRSMGQNAYTYYDEKYIISYYEETMPDIDMTTGDPIDVPTGNVCTDYGDCFSLQDATTSQPSATWTSWMASSGTSYAYYEYDPAADELYLITSYQEEDLTHAASYWSYPYSYDGELTSLYQGIYDLRIDTFNNFDYESRYRMFTGEDYWYGNYDPARDTTMYDYYDNEINPWGSGDRTYRQNKTAQYFIDYIKTKGTPVTNMANSSDGMDSTMETSSPTHYIQIGAGGLEESRSTDSMGADLYFDLHMGADNGMGSSPTYFFTPYGTPDSIANNFQHKFTVVNLDTGEVLHSETSTGGAPSFYYYDSVLTDGNFRAKIESNYDGEWVETWSETVNVVYDTVYEYTSEYYRWRGDLDGTVRNYNYQDLSQDGTGGDQWAYDEAFVNALAEDYQNNGVDSMPWVSRGFGSVNFDDLNGNGVFESNLGDEWSVSFSAILDEMSIPGIDSASLTILDSIDLKVIDSDDNEVYVSSSCGSDCSVDLDGSDLDNNQTYSIVLEIHTYDGSIEIELENFSFSGAGGILL